jgi:O-antigen/teichoic acid export membrane protein
MLGCLGLQSMLQREWPVNLVRGQERRAIVRAAQCNIVSVVCAVAMSLPAVAGHWWWPAMTMFAIGVLHGLSQQLFLVATVESRSRGNAVKFSIQNLVRSVVSFVVVVAVASVTRAAVLVLLSEALVTGAMALVLFSGAARRARTELGAVYALAVRRLPGVDWVSSITLMVFGVIAFLTINVDRWVAAGRLAPTEFAKYSFAWIILSAAQSAQGLINASVYPMVARRSASAGRDSAYRLCKDVSVGMLVVGLVAAVPSWMVADYAIRRWFPMYGGATPLIIIFSCVAVLRVSDFWSSYLLIDGHERALLLMNSMLLLVCLGVWEMVMVLKRDVGGNALEVAILTACISVSCYAGAVVLARRVRSE